MRIFKPINLFSNLPRSMRVGVCILIVGITGLLVFVGWRWQSDLHSNLSTVDGVIGRVGRHVTLPDDEAPALITVTDASKLTTKFLKQAKNGDKILIYQTHQKAIIYRSSIDRVIDIVPVVIDAPQAVGVSK